ncbi:MAG: class I SAM-dependent methyltransferase family protein [Methanobacteriota archaeon]|nr:MAG: class I SAM-dependent methyltransferase family protein [Euryarchaeota archaeon]
MMLSLKVPLRDAERARRALVDSSLLDRDYVVDKDKQHIFFPLTREPPANFMESSWSVVEHPHNKLAGSECRGLKFPAMDIVGTIAIIEGSEEEARKIAPLIVKCIPSVETVLRKAGPMEGQFRTRKFFHVFGKETMETVYKENGVRISLDVSKTYFSPRLSTERARIAALVRKGENVAVLFGGVAPFALVIAKKCPSCNIISVELNEDAHSYAVKNIELNKFTNVKALHMDVKELKRADKYKGWADRIIMPLPKDVVSFLDVAAYMARPGATLHIYIFASSPKEALSLLATKLDELNVGWEHMGTRECGNYSPTTSRYVVDIKLL